MEPTLLCPTCHTSVRVSDYFCFNCGANLKPKPPSLNVVDIIILFAISLFLPPFGIFKGLKYLKSPDQNSKIIGVMAIVVTIISLVATIVFTINLSNSVNEQINSQMQNFGGF